MEDSETVNEEEEDRDGSESTDENEASLDDDSDDDSGGTEVDLELRNKIEEALRVNGIEPATGETDSEDEELMDDDQMMAIDEQLAQVFRSRTNEKKGGKCMLYQSPSQFFMPDACFKVLMPSERPHISRIACLILSIYFSKGSPQAPMSYA
jgi:DNA polymerase phi